MFRSKQIKVMKETSVIYMTIEELKTLVENAVRAAMPKELSIIQPELPINGIHALAKFLSISPSRAQELKNDGIIPYLHDDRLVLFDPYKLRELMHQNPEPF